MNHLQITKEQAEAILQVRLQQSDFGWPWVIVCKGYNDDWDESTEVTPDDLEMVAEGAYDDYELWWS